MQADGVVDVDDGPRLPDVVFYGHQPALLRVTPVLQR
jgi:hypothetical protein